MDMNMRRGLTKRRPRGQIIVVLAVVLPALLGSMALATDIGLLYFNWQMLQKAADAGALAGANYLPLSPAQAVTNASNYAQANDIAANEIVSITVSSNNTSLNIQLVRTVPYNFAVLLGLFKGTVAAQATAQIQTIGSTTGVTPIGIDYRTQYSAGQTVNLMEGQVGPGNWGPLALGGTGASTLANNIEYGYQGLVSNGDWVSTETGIEFGPVQTAFDYLISEGQSVDPGGTFANHTLTDPRVLIVPMVDYSSINGSAEVPVKGFAALWLVSIDSNNNITTYFINQVAAGSTPDSTASNFGAYNAVLIQ